MLTYKQIFNCVYAFRSPLDGHVYYVGQTGQFLHRRVVEHFNQARAGSELPFHQWIRDLQAQDVIPIVEPLEIVPLNASRFKREQHWIAHFLKQGEPLTNGFS